MQFIRFLVTGGIAALANIGSRYMLTPVLGFDISVIVAYIIGMSVAYVLARRFVFEASKGGAGQEAMRFVLVNLVALVVVWAVSAGLLRIIFPAIGWTWRAEDLAHIAGVLTPAVTSYFGHRYFTFKS